MIEKFADLSNRLPSNNEFQAQRERLAKFYQKLDENLRHIRSELGDEINTLKERDFDSKMLQLLTKVYFTVISLHKEVNPEKPYIAAEKLVHYVLDKPNAPYIDNLDFLTKHHLKQTNVDFKLHPALIHPEMNSLDALKKLAIELRAFMQKNPLIKLPNLSVPPVGLQENLKAVPAFFAGQDDKTKT